MFSKALFRQSCKANGVMWSIITFAVCFMLACVMLISGSGNIGATKDAIEDTIIQKEIDAALENRAINYYTLSDDALNVFDKAFTDAFDKTEYAKNVASLVLSGKTQEEAQKSAALKYYLAGVFKLQQSAKQLWCMRGKVLLSNIVRLQHRKASFAFEHCMSTVL